MIVARRWLTVAIAATLVQAGVAGAQAQAERPDPQRAALEQRLRERTAQIVQRRLNLTTEQMTQLQTTNQRYETQRIALITRERDVRQNLRREIAVGDGANQARVGELLDQMMQLERQRLDMVQNEQRDLAKFMTPVQRARLFGLQNELRQRAQELRNRPGAGRNRPARRPLRLNR